MNEQDKKAYVEDKALVLLTISFGTNLARNRGKIDEYKDFILSIIKDCQPKVSRIEARKVWDKIACEHCEDIMPKDFIKWLIEAGVEVGE